MEKEIRILVLEDSPTDMELLIRELCRGGISHTAMRVETGNDFLRAMESFSPDIILSDYSLPSFDGLTALVMAREKMPGIPFIFVTGTMGEEIAIESLKNGATDYVLKQRLDRIVPSVRRALKETEEQIKRREAEAALRESEARYRCLLESVTDYIYTVEVENDLPLASNHSPGCLTVTGYAPEDFSGDPMLWYRMVHEEDRSIVLEQVNRVLSGSASPLEHRIVHKDGGIRWVRNTPVLSRDSQGRILSYDGLISDITERKRSEEKLHSSEEKYRRISQQFNALLDNLPDGIAQIAPDFEVIWASRSLTDLIKADDKHLEGNCCYQAFWNFREPCAPCPVARCFKSGKIEEGNNKLPDGRLLELRAVPICDESGGVESVIEVIRDITEHRRLEDQLRQAQKMESIGTLAGGIAHDFNNILTAIVGYGYITLMNMGPDDPMRQNIEHLLEGADRAAHLTKDLLIFSRKQVSEKMPVDLNEIVTKVEKFLVRVIGEDISCTIALHTEPLVIHADGHQLEQVLMNLATNSRDAMAGGGELVIGTKRISLGDDFIPSHGYGKPGRYALLTMSDTGEGMDEDTRRKIFDPFFTTKEVGKGTGLGLAVVYGIIKDHEGFINVYSEPGAGTTFRIYLPLISAEIPEEETVHEEKIPVRGTETILLVEDDESVRRLVTILLEQEGYTVIEAVDGAVAVKKFMENREAIDILISDLIMPRMNGQEAYDEMKSWRPGLKAIFMSGYAPDIIRQRMLLEGGVTLISKPVLSYALLKTVRNLLDEDEEK